MLTETSSQTVLNNVIRELTPKVLNDCIRELISSSILCY